MTKILTRIGAIPAVLSGALLMPKLVLAQAFQDAQDLVQDVGGSAGIESQTSLPELIGQIINIILGFLGIVLLLLILYAGFLWMTAGGDEGKVKTARQIIANAIIGLIIIVAAFAISNFVLGALVDVTQ